MFVCNLHKNKITYLIMFLCAFLFASSSLFCAHVSADSVCATTPAGDLDKGKAGFTTQPYTVLENGQTYLKFNVVISYQNVKFNNKIDITIFTAYDNFQNATWVTDQASYTHKEKGDYSELSYTVNLSKYKDSTWLMDSMHKGYVVGVNTYNNPWCQPTTYYSNKLSGQVSSTQIHITSAPNSIFASNDQYNSATAQVIPANTTDSVQWSASSASLAGLTASFLNNGKSDVDSSGKAVTKFNVPFQNLLTKVNTDPKSYGFPLRISAQAGNNRDNKDLYIGGLKAIECSESDIQSTGLVKDNTWQNIIDQNAFSQLLNSLNKSKHYWYAWFYWPENATSPAYLGRVSGVTNAGGILQSSLAPANLTIKNTGDNNFITQAVKATKDSKPLSIQLVVCSSSCQSWQPWSIAAASNRAQVKISPAPSAPELVSVPEAFNFGTIPVSVIAKGDSTKNYTAEGEVSVKNANHSWQLTANQTRSFSDIDGNNLNANLSLNGIQLGKEPQIVYSGSSTTPAAFSDTIQGRLQFPSGAQNQSVNANENYSTTISWNLTVTDPTLPSAH
ncbi:hypothetical protein [Liquorilactobacillus aquaticus]|nr:hypothetical protein [Liquorilactobacillus aquaticus]